MFLAVVELNTYVDGQDMDGNETSLYRAPKYFTSIREVRNYTAPTIPRWCNEAFMLVVDLGV
jgi:hypothetical protein